MTKTQAEDIERQTQGQAEVGMWFHHRRPRLTASNFGTIAKRRDTTPVTSTVKYLLYNKNLETKAMRWGKTHEPDARSAYIQYLHSQGHHHAKVTNSGLVVDLDDPCLGCSPDALVTIPGAIIPQGIAEFKCPYTAQFQTPAEAASSNQKFFCSLSSSGEMKLKRRHNYYYQVQGTLAITKRYWCDFVVWSPKGMTVERINADSRFWETIKNKLVDFYKQAILPELANPRVPRGQSIREPFLTS